MDALKAENRRLQREVAGLRAGDQLVREREQILQVILDSATDVIVTIDARSEIMHINAAVHQVFGYSATELIGQPVTVLMPEELREKHRSGIDRFVRTGKTQPSWSGLRFRGLHRNGRQFPIEISFGVTRRPDGSPRFTGIIRDVSALVSAEERLRRQVADLEHRQRLLSVGEMATGLAHELNQPLLAMCLQADAANRLLDSLPGVDGEHETSSELKTALTGIADQAERASSIIKSVRNLVRRETSQKSSVAVSELLDDVLPICKHYCAQAELQLAVSIPSGLPAVRAESVQIGQVLVNLIQNAVNAMQEKYVDTQQIEVTAKAAGEFIEISVRDYGKGFTNDEAQHLFDSFYTTRADGLGLGLAICHTIIEEHGGQIRASRPTGLGATFSFTLPVAVDPECGG